MFILHTWYATDLQDTRPHLDYGTVYINVYRQKTYLYTDSTKIFRSRNSVAVLKSRLRDDNPGIQ